MKFLKNLSLTMIAVAAATSSAHAAPANVVDSFPKTPTCVRAQRAVQRDPSQSVWNGLGITSWLSADICALDVTFEDGAKLLAFVDARIAAGKNPTLEIVKGAGGHDFGVKLIMEVVGPIVAQSAGDDDGAQEFAAQATQKELMVLQDAFVKKYFGLPGIGMNAVGITAAMFQPALSVGFEQPIGLHNYLVKALAAGEIPSPITGRVNGKLVSAPVVFEIIGPIGAQGVGSISN